MSCPTFTTLFLGQKDRGGHVSQEHTHITDCCDMERRTKFSLTPSTAFPGPTVYITSLPSMSKQARTMQCSQNNLLEARLPPLPISPPNFRGNCRRRKNQSDKLFSGPVVKDSWAINGTYTSAQRGGLGACSRVSMPRDIGWITVLSLKRGAIIASAKLLTLHSVLVFVKTFLLCLHLQRSISSYQFPLRVQDDSGGCSATKK